MLIGNEDDDTLFGLSGVDEIFGNDGNDHLGGGSGNDFLYGGRDADVIDGSIGDDYLESGEGIDQVIGGVGFDVYRNTLDTDQTLSGNTLHSTLTQPGTNTIQSVEAVEIIGGPSANKFRMLGRFDGLVTVDGGDGTDTIESSANYDVTLANATLSRADGLNVSLLSIENANLIGGSAGNVFRLDRFAGPVDVDGGGGTDLVVAAGDGNYTLTDVSFARPQGATATHSNVEQFEITGGPSANTIDASAFSGQVRLFGRDGADILTGGSGDDLIDGGTGADTIAGGGGDDDLALAAVMETTCMVTMAMT